MDFLVELIHNYGYYIVFIGTLLEGEIVVALAGFVAYQGGLELGLLIPIAIAGAVIGDQSFFYFGRLKGRTILRRHPEWHDRVEKIHVWMVRYQDWLIFGSRFLYGFRAIIPVVIGTSKVSGIRYFILNLMGAIVWAHLFVFGGYAFGGAIERFLGNMKKFEGGIVAAIILVTVVIQTIAWFRRRRERLLLEKSEKHKRTHSK